MSSPPNDRSDPPLPAEGSDTLLRLVALDGEDLAVISAHLQDTQVAVGEITFLPDRKRFVLAGRRFDWAMAAAGGCERCATGLHFERVLAVGRAGFAQDDGGRVLNLLAIEFAPTDMPAGQVTLTFSGGAAIRLDVECLEAQMRDLGERWPCDQQPAHPIGEVAATAA